MAQTWVEHWQSVLGLTRKDDQSLATEHRICDAGGILESYLQADAAVPASKLHYTISDALINMVTGRNDFAILSLESHTQSAALDWSKNLTHLVGSYPEAMSAQRSRIGHDANFSPLLTVSGYGNLFANLYFMYGRGSATNLICLHYLSMLPLL